VYKWDGSSKFASGMHGTHVISMHEKALERFEKNHAYGIVAGIRGDNSCTCEGTGLDLKC